MFTYISIHGSIIVAIVIYERVQNKKIYSFKITDILNLKRGTSKLGNSNETKPALDIPPSI